MPSVRTPGHLNSYNATQATLLDCFVDHRASTTSRSSAAKRASIASSAMRA